MHTPARRQSLAKGVFAMDKSIHLDHLALGVCYYPEHWDEALWADDLRRMKQYGIETVRVFEFAWSIVEPRDGEYDFALFDRFLDLAAREGMQVIMCTPTATPPAWLTYAHPEVLSRDKDGRAMHHGHRRHYNYNAPAYRDYTARIVGQLARRYGGHPAIIGWQLDNELNCEMNEFYSDADRAAFREYLKARFGTLDALNEAIGARFWNQTYSDWAQVDLERPTIHGHANPHMALLSKAFFSESAIGFAKLQSDILRPLIGKRFITTNGIFGHLDSAKLTREALDFIMYDSYPNFAYGDRGVNASESGALGDRAWSLNLSRARAFSPNFGVMEQQSGANGWDFSMLAPMPLPGQMRLWTMQSVAHGADYVSFFRWRTAPYGTEIYWHGLNDYSNRPNRRLEELKRISADFQALGFVSGSRYEAKAALLCDYLNEWDGERDKWHGPLDESSRMALLSAAQKSHTPLDLVYLTETLTLNDLKKYAVLFYPHAAILTGKTAALLGEYCAAGGALVMGARTGYKDEFGRCPMRPMPGPARELCGVEVADYTLPHPSEQVSILWDGAAYPAPNFREALRPLEGTHPLAVFKGGHMAGQCALSVKYYVGGGAAYYLGSGFSEPAAAALLSALNCASPYRDIIDCPSDVELAVRRGARGDAAFLLNYSARAQSVRLGGALTSALSGKTCAGEITLEPYGVEVLKL